jgi:hypothetical protein
MASEARLQEFLEPLRQKIESLEDRLRQTEETLAQVLKALPAPLTKEVIVSPFQSLSLAPQPGP